MLKHIFVVGMILMGQLVYGRVSEEKKLEVLDVDEYLIAKPFFDDYKINMCLLHSIIENKCAGKILTDDKTNPSFMLVCSPASYTFLNGNLNQNSLKKISAYLKTLPKVSLACPLDSSYRSFFEEEGFITVERLQFRRPNHSNHFSFGEKYSINKVDEVLFPLCDWHSFILSIFGDYERFFTYGMGFCLLDEGHVVSESFAIIADGMAELGVVTNENYRRQHLATTICTVLLDYCYQNNLKPFWTCDMSNLGSIGVAKKLGFEEDCKYFHLKWTSS